MTISEALYSPRSSRTLLSFKDIRENEYHVETAHENGVDYLYMTSTKYGQKRILEKIEIVFQVVFMLPQYTWLKITSSFAGRRLMKALICYGTTVWGHPGRNTMLRTMNASHGHPLGGKNFVINPKSPCQACSIGKTNLKPIHVKPTKLVFEFLREFKLRAHHSDYPIKSIRLDNAAEFTSKTFDDYCMTLGIEVEHPVAYVHTQNGLAEAFIKRLQMIARTLLVTGYEPDVSHLRVFGCLVNVPIEPPKRSKFGPQKRRGIYVGYETPSIIRYLEPLTGDLFTARHADCDFDETVFPSLGGDSHVNVDKERRELTWHVPTQSYLDPPTAHSDKEVQRILSLQNVANQLPDAFNDLANVTRSHIPAANVPARIDVPVGRRVPVEHVASVEPTEQRTLPSAVQSAALPKKRGRPIGSKDVQPRKRRTPTKPVLPHEIIKDYGDVLEERVPDETPIPPNPENLEISVNHASLDDILKRNETIMMIVFIYAVAADIMSNDDMEPRTVAECQRRTDWPKWKQAIQVELDSLAKRSVFGPVAPTPPNVKPVVINGFS
ncbi:hypothetical protein M0R45_018177 [Rubus argutus]|uniref:Integrase catalytic domain-containing protein n=1 Tax=Rubus argutus TaxID=59490 RepID=A0AAW1X1S5_RUBAR